METTIYNEYLTPTTDSNPLTFTFQNRVWPINIIQLFLVDSTTGVGSFLAPANGSSPNAYSYDPDIQVLTLTNNPNGLLPVATYSHE